MIFRVGATCLLLACGAFAASCDCESCNTPPAPIVQQGGQPTPTTPPTTPTPPASASKTPADAEPDAVYIVRGKIVELPDPQNPVTEFQVHHEAIDAFKNGSGDIVGMGAMIMPFPLGEGVSLQGYAVGDVVEMTFADYYKPIRHFFVTGLKKLPADTVLEFRKSAPPPTALTPTSPPPPAAAPTSADPDAPSPTPSK